MSHLQEHIRGVFMKSVEKLTNIKILIAVFAILISVCIGSVWYIFNETFKWSMAAEYNGYEDAFSIVKDFIAEQYPDEEDKIVWVEYDKASDENYLRDFDTHYVLECSSDVKEALKILQEGAFRYTNSLSHIRINGDRIAFCIEAGYYAVVYSPDKEPTVVSGIETKEEEVYVKEAEEDWYHVRTK